jgi:transcriptional regulator GlxA family with amidase domain
MSRKTIAFLVFPDMTPLDLIGPLQVIKCLEHTGEFVVVTVGEHIAPMDTDIGLKIQPERTFAEVVNPDVLVVPGGVLGPMKAIVNDPLMAYVRAAGAAAEVVASVCTGSIILAAAGLLAGRRATTHWGFMHHLDKFGVHPVHERWVEDGKFITSAGVSAGIDMALALAARLSSVALARTIQLILEYDPTPPFGDIEREAVDEAEINRQMVSAGAPNIPGILSAKPELLNKLYPTIATPSFVHPSDIPPSRIPSSRIPSTRNPGSLRGLGIPRPR